jgi:hypothetical protein
MAWHSCDFSLSGLYSVVTEAMGEEIVPPDSVTPRTEYRGNIEAVAGTTFLQAISSFVAAEYLRCIRHGLPYFVEK